MNNIQEYAIVIGITLAGWLFLALMVRKDLAHKIGLSNVQQWGLVGALGTGLLAFSIKLFLIVFLSHMTSEQLIPTSSEIPLSAIKKPATPTPTSTIYSSASYQWQALPDKAPEPTDNPSSAEKVRLGKTLFFDKNLSFDRTLSCASCHGLYRYSGTDGAAVSTGIYGQTGDRNAPTVWNAGFQKHLFWDGRSPSLEDQALQPFLNPVEMGMASAQAVVDRVKEQSQYPSAFQQVFGPNSVISIELITKAIASYERTLITNDSAYDDFVRGNPDALSKQQLNGMRLFEKLGCIQCHSGPNFSVASVFNPGTSFRLFPANPTVLTKQYDFNNQQGKPSVWRVPSLRNVALTGPWFHNGKVDDLHEAVRIMASAQLGKKEGPSYTWSNDGLVTYDNPLPTDSEIDDIVAFLHALSSKRLLNSATLLETAAK